MQAFVALATVLIGTIVATPYYVSMFVAHASPDLLHNILYRKVSTLVGAIVAARRGCAWRVPGENPRRMVRVLSFLAIPTPTLLRLYTLPEQTSLSRSTTIYKSQLSAQMAMMVLLSLITSASSAIADIGFAATQSVGMMDIKADAKQQGD